MQQRNAKRDDVLILFSHNYKQKTEVVTTFMALLELMKKGYIRVEQKETMNRSCFNPAGKNI